MEEHPFPELKISDFSFLDSTEKRGQCPKCNRSRKYYCYTCYKPVNDFIADRIPKVKLPVKIDIIKHPNEVDGKSTSPHAAILAPEDITIYEYPCIPTYDTSKTILIFPGPKSCDLEDVLSLKKCTRENDIKKGGRQPSDLQTSAQDIEIPQDNNELRKHTTSTITEKNAKISAKRNHETAFNCEVSDNEMNKIKTKSIQIETDISHQICNSNKNDLTVNEIHCDESKTENVQWDTIVTPWFDKVVFIDSTWNQTPTIANDERLKDITRVEIKLRKTKFWRTQDGNPDEYLSTIEAIYYFLTDFHKLCVNQVYKDDYDNLLFFFCFNYNKIKQASGGGGTLRAYSKKKKER